ncbi:MAG: nucleotide exchange factor GrpE [Candidatus Nitronauta litoralis]|uniref:Protein GrpE n=1 Tax=Candidatus Nitronauta litoralis TaxID=2705533 RepID=A0A7T0G1F1_9BACT|nr:MAG: nucleotide exchange factor GrpE [Candidatus Nitronauta litoralis]
MNKEQPLDDIDDSNESKEHSEDSFSSEEEEIEIVEEPLDPLEQKENELSDLKEEMMRLRAETDNFRKRLSKEKEDSVRYANEKLFKDLVPIYDNLKRALEAPDVNVKSLKEGVDMIGKQFLTFLEKHHVKPIEALGETFDPNLHEVLSQIESEEHEEDVVIDEFGKGYYIHDRVLMPSKVVTSKKPQGSSSEENASSEETAG